MEVAFYNLIAEELAVVALVDADALESRVARRGDSDMRLAAKNRVFNFPLRCPQVETGPASAEVALPQQGLIFSGKFWQSGHGASQ